MITIKNHNNFINETLCAVIPAKGKSGRLPNKNILDFHGNPLIVHKIKQLQNVKKIDEIIVSSDSDEILELAKKNGCTAIKRPTRFTLDEVNISEFFSYIGDVIKHDNMLWACCTSPTVDEGIYNEAISSFEKNVPENYDSLITTYRFQHYLFDEDGPFNFDIGENHKYSQNLPHFDLFTNGAIISPLKKVSDWKSNFGSNPYRLELDQYYSLDIDTKTDFDIARLLYGEKKLK